LATLLHSIGTRRVLTMRIASAESAGPRNVEIGLRSLDQQKPALLQESDEDQLLRELTRFVENSDQSIPRIATLLGVSDVVLSMWIARTTKPIPIKFLEIRKFLREFCSGPAR
jgi:hypothetical protein